MEFDGEERVRRAYGQGKGVLFITGHFGFWEIHAVAHPLRFEPIGVLARTLDNAAQHAARGHPPAHRQRRPLPAGFDPEGDAPAVGEARVAILIDQHISSADAVHVEFFERPAATTSAVAAMALRTGAPVVPVFALPSGRGRYRLIYEHPVEPPSQDSEERSASSRSDARTYWRCTSVAIRISGCGCTAAGVTTMVADD